MNNKIWRKKKEWRSRRMIMKDGEGERKGRKRLRKISKMKRKKRKEISKVEIKKRKRIGGEKDQ